MTFYAISALINALTSTGLGFFVIYKKRDKLNLSFSLFSLSVAFWSFAYFFWQIAANAQGALFWCRILTLGSILIPIFYLRFVLVYLEIESKKYNKILLYIGYFLAAILLLASPTNLLVKNVLERLVFKFWPVAGNLYWLFLLMFSGFVIYSFYLFALFYKKEKGTRRGQIKFLLIGTGLGFLGGATNFFLWYNVPILPVGNILVCIYVILAAYAIVAHRLMDIKVAMRRSSVYLASILTIIIPASAIFYAIGLYYSDFLIPASLIIIVLGVTVFPPIKNYFYRLANKYFFSSLYDSSKVISELTDKLRSTLEVNRIYSDIGGSLKNAFHSKAIAIFTYDEKIGGYDVRHSEGFDFGGQENFPSDAVIHEKLNEQKAVVVEELRKEYYQKHSAVFDLWQRSGIEIVAPLNLKGKTIGMIVLSGKESRDMYNNEDFRVLEIIGAQAAIAIENALLYEETKNFNAVLKSEVKKATEDLRKANEELQKLDRAKSDFISIASHQLRTPLSVIKGFISMILEGSYGAVSEDAKDKLRKSFDSAERLVKLVDALLDLTHMEGGKIQFEFAKVNYGEMVRSVVDELSVQAAKKNLELEFEKPGKESWVWADEQKLRQVVFNLTDNAIKYTNQGWVRIKMAERDGEIELAIKDTGMGMRVEEIPNLFQKFVRGPNAPRIHTEGAGVGLYVARKLIEEHKGDVWAESPGEGFGSTFFIKLPKWKESDSKKPKEKA